jgi:hypothetical protein
VLLQTGLLSYPLLLQAAWQLLVLVQQQQQSLGVQLEIHIASGLAPASPLQHLQLHLLQWLCQHHPIDLPLQEQQLLPQQALLHQLLLLLLPLQGCWMAAAVLLLLRLQPVLLLGCHHCVLQDSPQHYHQQQQQQQQQAWLVCCLPQPQRRQLQQCWRPSACQTETASSSHAPRLWDCH